MKTLVSLFDLTGYAVEPFTNAGWRTIVVDTQHRSVDHPRATMALNISINDETEKFIQLLCPDLILSFPPCTDMAVSGAAHFEKKRLADPHFQDKAAHLARAAQRIGDALGVPYMAENPISVLATLWAFLIWPKTRSAYWRRSGASLISFSIHQNTVDTCQRMMSTQNTQITSSRVMRIQRKLVTGSVTVLKCRKKCQSLFFLDIQTSTRSLAANP